MEKVIKRCFISSIIIFIVYILIVTHEVYNSESNSYIDFNPLSFMIFIMFLIPYNIFVIFIYLLEIYNKIIYIITLLIIVLLFFLIDLNYNDFSNYENWQYYNRQPVITHSLDYFIGKNLLELYFLLKIFLMSYAVSVTILIYNYFKKQ